MAVPIDNQEMPLSIRSFQSAVSVSNENNIFVVNRTHEVASKEDPDSSKVLSKTFSKPFNTLKNYCNSASK